MFKPFFKIRYDGEIIEEKVVLVHILYYKLELNLIFIDFVEDKVTIILGHHLNNIVLIEKSMHFIIQLKVSVGFVELLKTWHNQNPHLLIAKANKEH